MPKYDPPEGTFVVLQFQFIGDKDRYEELYVTAMTADVLRKALLTQDRIPVTHIEEGEYVESVIVMRNVTMATVVPVRDE
jgi:hypothetical protein